MDKKLFLSTIVFGFLGFAAIVLAGNISPQPAEHWAWNDAIGWIDFAGANVPPDKLTGYGTTVSVGEVALDCATTPAGNICASNNFGVADDGFGNLSGWAWNDAIGWISFWCGHSDAGGANTCATSDYKVKTSWIPGTPMFTGFLTSSVFDAGVRVALNSVLWRGTLNGLSSSSVKFRIASSNCPNGKTNPPLCDDAGVWQFFGPSGSTTEYYIPLGPNAPASVSTQDHSNVRYFRYRVFIDSNVFGTVTPEVNDVIINWSA